MSSLGLRRVLGGGAAQDQLKKGGNNDIVSIKKMGGAKPRPICAESYVRDGGCGLAPRSALPRFRMAPEQWWGAG